MWFAPGIFFDLASSRSIAPTDLLNFPNSAKALIFTAMRARTSFGWPSAFVFFGMLTVLLAIVFAKKAKRTEDAHHSHTKISDILRLRGLRTVLVFNSTIGLFMKGVELFFPTYLKDNRGIEPMWASIAFTLMLATGAVGQWIGGETASKVGSKKVVIVTMTGVCAGACAILLECSCSLLLMVCPSMGINQL